MIYESTPAGRRCLVPGCEKVLTWGRGLNFTEAAHARAHVARGEMIEEGRGSSRGKLRFRIVESPTPKRQRRTK